MKLTIILTKEVESIEQGAQLTAIIKQKLALYSDIDIISQCVEIIEDQ